MDRWVCMCSDRHATWLLLWLGWGYLLARGEISRSSLCTFRSMCGIVNSQERHQRRTVSWWHLPRHREASRVSPICPISLTAGYLGDAWTLMLTLEIQQTAATSNDRLC